MKLITITPEELETLISEAVEKSVSKSIPAAIRTAVRKDFITTDELITLTGWSRRSIQHLRDSRQLPFYQDGRRILFKTDEVEKYIQDRRVRARGK